MKLKLLALAMLIASFAATSAEAKSAAEFVKKASIGGEYEVASSKIALEKSGNADVKAFAQAMIDDHTKAGNELKAVVQSSTPENQKALMNSVDSTHEKMLKKLQSLSGKKFDKEYVHQQTRAHKKTVALFKDYAKNGNDPALKNFAGQTLPTLEQHLDHVKNLKSSI